MSHGSVASVALSRASLAGILFIVAFPVLFWNEGQHAVVSVALDRVETGNEGKLIHVTGTATTTDIVTDPVFGVSANALKLKRVVEYYSGKSHSTPQQKRNSVAVPRP